MTSGTINDPAPTCCLEILSSSHLTPHWVGRAYFSDNATPVRKQVRGWSWRSAIRNSPTHKNVYIYIHDQLSFSFSVLNTIFSLGNETSSDLRYVRECTLLAIISNPCFVHSVTPVFTRHEEHRVSNIARRFIVEVVEWRQYEWRPGVCKQCIRSILCTRKMML